jgi:hypothetical protein
LKLPQQRARVFITSSWYGRVTACKSKPASTSATAGRLMTTLVEPHVVDGSCRVHQTDHQCMPRLPGCVSSSYFVHVPLVWCRLTHVLHHGPNPEPVGLFHAGLARKAWARCSCCVAQRLRGRECETTEERLEREGNDARGRGRGEETESHRCASRQWSRRGARLRVVTAKRREKVREQ